MRFLLLWFLTTILTSAFLQADNYMTQKRQWDRCTQKTLKSKNAPALKRKSRSKTEEKQIITQCGFRPVQLQGELSALASADCKMLFKFAGKAECSNQDYSEHLDLFMMELNPSAFNEQEYKKACNEVDSTTYAQYKVFRKKVCYAKAL